MTVLALSNALKSLLTRAGVENPAGDCELILEHTLGYSRAQIVAHRADETDAEQSAEAVALAKRRASGEPIQYILGSWSFMGRDYAVGPGVLIPRDDTEVVVGAALGLMRGVPSPAIVDLCAGSGIIAITLCGELPRATVAAVEKSPHAFAYLERNAALNRAELNLIRADLCDCADRFDDRSLDLIVSNPPYIKSGEIASLQSEVQYEPRLALDGGESGFDFYEKIIALWTPKLRAGGVIALELGEEQFGRVSEVLEQNGYTEIRGYPDIQGVTRAVTARAGCGQGTPD